MHFSALLIILDIDNGLRPLASGNVTPEQDVNLAEGPVLHLRDEHPREESTDEGSASPDVAALATQVPLVAVQHVAGKEDAGNVDQVVSTTSNTCCQRSETDGWCLTNDDPGCRCRSQTEEHRDNQAKGCLCVARCGAEANRSGDAECDQEDAVDGLTVNVDGSAAEVCGEDPRQHDHEPLEGGGSKAECEGGVVSHTGLWNFVRISSDCTGG